MSTDVLIFAPYTGGHHAEYLRHLLAGSRVYADNLSLRLAVAPAMLDQHPDLTNLACSSVGCTVELVTVPGTELLTTEGVGLLRRGLWHRRVLQELAERFRPRHVFLTYLDHAQLALASRVRLKGNPHLSGILFRPTLHYGKLGRAEEAGDESRIQAIRKRFLLGAALRHPQLTTVLSLDPTATDAINEYASGATVISLPDPLPPQASTLSPDAVRNHFGLASERRCALLFGALTERKGVLQLLDAAARLPAPTAARIALVLAGQVAEPLWGRIWSKIHEAEQAGVQIILVDRFMEDGELANLIHAADVVLLPYQKHVGSSGLLIRAAAAGKPVIGQRYGLIGYLIDEHALGLTCDTSDGSALAEALSHLAEDDVPFDPAAAARWADQNSVEAFQHTIWTHILRTL